MKSTFIALSLLLTYTMAIAQVAGRSNFILSAPGHATTIFVGAKEKEVVRIAANALADDIAEITGNRPLVTSDSHALKGSVILLGTFDQPVIRSACKGYAVPDLRNKWEHFFIRVLDPISGASPVSSKVLVIAGSDARGAAYGAFTVTRLIGVSPWKWWADVTPHKKKELVLDADIDMAQGPSVKYRGIFLNDEDWGLRPWASKTFEPNVGNIGPKTYAKIFELLLRLKANTIWPAMHPGTMPFFTVPGNEEMAKRYDIVVGTSHAEPMMRNNVGEWNAKTMGPFNYVTNRDSVYDYWKRRVMQVAGDDNIYTIGMRGVHDSKMEGATTLAQQAAVLTQVFKDQRGLLKKYVNPDVTQVPQVFIPYKEVLPVYDYGLKVPDDVTLMWTDDNYGYIRRLSDRKERQREGSSGIYYHLSYWGRPHDYLWLSSTEPGLIFEEMKKAWDFGAHRIWIANVGDIKPAEYDIQFFLDMAWNIDSIRANNITAHMRQWSAHIFGAENAEAVTEIMNEYYRLAFIRRPEFMGWSQTEPNTPTRNTAFNAFLDRGGIAGRLRRYQQLIARVEKVKGRIPDDRKNAYFELVTYPVEGAAYMNEKFLYAQKSRLFARYQLPAANHYAALARQAYDSIKILTAAYNSIANGKWKHIMSMSPRGLAAYGLPPLPDKIQPVQKGILAWLSEQPEPVQGTSLHELPPFNPYNARHHFIYLFNRDTNAVKWQVKVDNDWIRVNKTSGSLTAEDKITVSIDWRKAPLTAGEGGLVIRSGDSSWHVAVTTEPPIKGKMPPNAIVEQDGHVYMSAGDFISKQDYSKEHQWKGIQELGYSDSAYTLLPVCYASDKGIDSAYLEYRFYTYSKGPAEIRVFALPTHPVNNDAQLRISVSVDKGEKQIISYKTTGRSRQWKQNVLSNHARCSLKYNFARAGWHTIKIYPLDPGVVIDQLMINFNLRQHIYAVPLKNQGIGINKGVSTSVGEKL